MVKILFFANGGLDRKFRSRNWTESLGEGLWTSSYHQFYS